MVVAWAKLVDTANAPTSAKCFKKLTCSMSFTMIPGPFGKQPSEAVRNRRTSRHRTMKRPSPGLPAAGDGSRPINSSLAAQEGGNHPQNVAFQHITKVWKVSGE